MSGTPERTPSPAAERAPRPAQTIMTRNRLLFFALSIALVLPIVTGTLLAASARGDNEGTDSLYKYLAVFTEVLTRVRGQYVEETDFGSLIDGALDGATDALDPFSLYLPAEAATGYVETRDRVSGLTGLVLLRDRGVLYAAGVQPGSPAAQAGVQLGDIISEIDGEPTRAMPLWQAQRALDREPGAAVSLEVVRFGDVLDLSLSLQPYEKIRASLAEQRGVAVLRIPGFGPGTANAVGEALASAAGSAQERMLVDLRSVAAGKAEAAYEVAGLFAGGELGTLIRRGETVTSYRSGEPVWQGRLVVLVNRGTLGAAEVLAAVLRQKLGAEVVGERTFGYAGRQAVADLSSGGRLLYTDAFYAGPDGEPLRQSLIPDVLVDDRARFLGDGEDDPDGADPILERGLDLLLGEEEPARKAA